VPAKCPHTKKSTATYQIGPGCCGLLLAFTEAICDIILELIVAVQLFRYLAGNFGNLEISGGKSGWVIGMPTQTG